MGDDFETDWTKAASRTWTWNYHIQSPQLQVRQSRRASREQQEDERDEGRAADVSQWSDNMKRKKLTDVVRGNRDTGEEVDLTSVTASQRFDFDDTSNSNIQVCDDTKWWYCEWHLKTFTICFSGNKRFHLHVNQGSGLTLNNSHDAIEATKDDIIILQHSYFRTIQTKIIQPGPFSGFYPGTKYGSSSHTVVVP